MKKLVVVFCLLAHGVLAQSLDVRVANITMQFLRQDGDNVVFALKFDVANYSRETATFLTLEALDAKGYRVTLEVIKHPIAARDRDFVYHVGLMSVANWHRTKRWLLTFAK